MEARTVSVTSFAAMLLSCWPWPSATTLLAGHSPANDAVAPRAIAPATTPASDSVRQSVLPFILLMTIKLLLFDAAAPTAMATALTGKMAQPRPFGKCRMSLVSIAAGYGLWLAPGSLDRAVGRLNRVAGQAGDALDRSHDRADPVRRCLQRLRPRRPARTLGKAGSLSAPCERALLSPW